MLRTDRLNVKSFSSPAGGAPLQISPKLVSLNTLALNVAVGLEAFTRTVPTAPKACSNPNSSRFRVTALWAKADDAPIEIIARKNVAVKYVLRVMAREVRDQETGIVGALCSETSSTSTGNPPETIAFLSTVPAWAGGGGGAVMVSTAQTIIKGPLTMVPQIYAHIVSLCNKLLVIRSQ